MNPAAPDGAPPRRIGVCRYICKTPHCPAVPRRGPEAGDPPEISWFNDFHGLGANTLFMPVSTKQKNVPTRSFCEANLFSCDLKSAEIDKTLFVAIAVF